MASASSADGQATGTSRGPGAAALSAPPASAAAAGWDRQAGRGYLKARLYAVRREYSRVRSDLLVSAPALHDGYWARASAQLDEAEMLLATLDAQGAAMAISQADQALVHLAGEASLERRGREVADELESRGLHAVAQRLRGTYELKSDVDLDSQPKSDEYRQELAGALAGAIDQVAQSQQEEWLNNDLQVARLRLLAGYASVALALTLAATMIAANPNPVHGWPVPSIASWPAPFASLAASAGVAVLGAAGGLFSGLLATQGAKTSLLGYRTSVPRLILKPLVGALMACIVYIALSWQVVPGVTVTNGGTFLVLGFVTGFSERYILRVLNVPGAADSDSGQDAKPRRHELQWVTPQDSLMTASPYRGTTGLE